MNLKRLLLVFVIAILFASCIRLPETKFESASPTTSAVQLPAIQELDYTQISFDDIAPSGVNMLQCWNGMGMDDQGRIYIGFTSLRNDGREDFPVFRYDPHTAESLFLGTFLEIVAVANNSYAGESIPKGHTRMIFAYGKMYMASQSFHDLKWEIDALPTYRGSHIFAYDTTAGTWEDLSAPMPEGVVTKHEGIVSLNILRSENLLVGLAHPSSDLVLYDYRTNELLEVVPGIPWRLGNPLSREIVVAPSGRIYTYRGTEDPKQHNESNPVWVYNLHGGGMRNTGYTMTNGFWIGQTEKRDGSKIYVSTTNGELYEFDTASETFKGLGYMLPKEQVNAGRHILYTYAITLSPDEKKIYIILSVLDKPAGSGELYTFDLETKEYTFVQQLPKGIYQR